MATYHVETTGPEERLRHLQSFIQTGIQTGEYGDVLMVDKLFPEHIEGNDEDGHPIVNPCLQPTCKAIDGCCFRDGKLVFGGISKSGVPGGVVALLSKAYPDLDFLFSRNCDSEYYEEWCAKAGKYWCIAACDLTGPYGQTAGKWYVKNGINQRTGLPVEVLDIDEMMAKARLGANGDKSADHGEERAEGTAAMNEQDQE